MTPPTPFTDDDNILLALYLDDGVALFAICDKLNITYSELERRLDEPHIREAIERAERLHTQRARTLARCRADDAVATLHHIASIPDHTPETRRKAASKLLSITTASGSERTTPNPSTCAQPTAPSPPGRGRLTCASRQPGESSPPHVRSTPHPQVPIAQCQVPPPTTHAYHLTPFTHPRTTRTENPRPP